MDHGAHHGPGHSGMSHGHHDDAATCSMNMLFTWSTENLCIVFPAWRITSTASLALSLALVAALTAGYEALRTAARRLDSAGAPSSGAPGTGPLPAAMWRRRPQRRALRAALYAAQVFYSFFIMLLFMTYNCWVMLAVAVGAFIGFLAFAPADEAAAKSVACH